MPAPDKKQTVALALGAVAVCCVFLFGREVVSQSQNGESRNPNFGHPTKSDRGKGRPSGPATAGMSEEQYYDALKINRPDLSEDQLRAKADHWWKVKNGQAQVTGG